MSEELFGTEEHRLFRDTVRRFVESELAPRAREFDEMGRIDKSLFRRMGELGMLGLRYDPKWGGAGLDWSYTTVLMEELTRADNAGVGMGITVHTDMATPSLHMFGSDDLRQQYLVPSIKGEMVSAIGVTEPDAGSDVAAIKTRAVRDGDDWVINGSKLYITIAATADWVCLLAVTDAEGRLRRFLADHRAHRLAGLPLRSTGQDRQLGLGHRSVVLRGCCACRSRTRSEI